MMHNQKVIYLIIDKVQWWSSYYFFTEVKITSTRGASKSIQYDVKNEDGSNTLITYSSSFHDPIHKKTIVAGHGQQSNGRYVMLNGRTNQVSAKNTFVSGRADNIADLVTT